MEINLDRATTDLLLAKPKEIGVLTRKRCTGKGCHTMFAAPAIDRDDLGQQAEINLCPTCRDNDWSRAVCLGCREVILLIKPHTDPRNGFTYRKRRHYHVPVCLRCVPGTTEAPILELQQHIQQTIRS